MWCGGGGVEEACTFIVMTQETMICILFLFTLRNQPLFYCALCDVFKMNMNGGVCRVSMEDKLLRTLS